MTKTIWIVAIAAAFVLGTSAGLYLTDNVAEAAAPPKTVLIGAPVTVDAINQPVQTGCALESVKHWDKIIFKVQPFELRSVEAGQPQPLFPSDSVLYDIKVPDDPTKVANLNQKVADFMNDHGYEIFDGKPTRHLVTPDAIEIVDVEYTTFCIQP